MPKLNVQQNNQNVIQSLANGVAIGQLNGIIKCDGANNFSVAEAGGGGGRNLLDNPWWGSGEVVNQRAANQLNPSAYGIDRWKGGSSGSVSVTSTGLAFGSSGGNAWQPMESVLRAWMVGKVFTASVLMSDGTIYSGQGTYGTGTTYFLSNPVELFISSAGNFNVRTSSAATVRAVKLELGSVSTLANDAPPDYAEELRKCQYYFVRLHETANYGYFPVGFGAEQASSALRMAIMTPTSLRRAPVTVSFSGTLNITGNGTRTTVTSMSILDVSDTAVLVSVVPASMPANQHTYTLSFGAQAYIDLSADL